MPVFTPTDQVRETGGVIGGGAGRRGRGRR
jgi:hypothetical protein